MGGENNVSSDAAGTIYAVWNAGPVNRGAERIYFSSSTTSGATWSPKSEVSNAPRGAAHAFPTVVAGMAGDVPIAWMDTRPKTLWYTNYPSSTHRGAFWSPATQLSTYAP